MNSRERSNLNLDQTTHGLSKKNDMHPLHRVWRSMRQRCMNPNDKRYAKYGRRGIKVCKRWNSFESFLADMGPRPEGVGAGGRSLYSVDRINNNGNYTPKNCRWATVKEQGRNMSSNRALISAGGEVMLLCEWAERLGVHRTAIHRRIKKGMSEAEALSKPFRRRS